MKKLLLLLTIGCIIGCKSTDNKTAVENETSIELIISGHDFEYGELNFRMEFANKSNNSIFILKPNDGTYGYPSFFTTTTNPKQDLCEIASTELKPLSHIIEIPPRTSQILEYKSAFFGPCDDISGQTIEFQVHYDFDFTDKEYLNLLNLGYEYDEKKVNAFQKLTKLSLKSNPIKIKMPTQP